MKRLAACTALLLLAASPAWAQQIVISEFLKDPISVDDTAGEWVELHNPTGSAVDLNGWTVSDGGTESHTIATSVTVPAGGYVVLGASSDSAANGGVEVDYAWSGFTLDNAADAILLRDAAADLVDSVAYDDGLNWPDPVGASVRLDDLAADNSLGANWSESPQPWYDGSDLGTPGYENNTVVFMFSSGSLDGFFEPWVYGYAVQGITALDLTLTFDAAVYDVSSVDPHPDLSGGTSSNWTAASVDWDWSGGPVTLFDDDIVLSLLGTVAGGPGDSMVTAVADSSIVSDANGPLPTLFIDGDWSVPGTPLPNLYITEVYQNPGGDDTGREWFEVYNDDTFTADLQGWTISDGGSDSFTLPTGTPIEVPAGAHYVFGASGDSASNGGVAVDYVWPGGAFALANGDDEVIITAYEGTEVDRIEYDGGTVWPDPDGASMALQDYTADNNDGAQWAASGYPWSDDPLAGLGTPGLPNTTPFVGWTSGTYSPGDTPALVAHKLESITALTIVHPYEETVFDITGFAHHAAFAGALTSTMDAPSAGFVTHSWSGPAVSIPDGEALVTLEGTVVGGPLASQLYTVDETASSIADGSGPLAPLWGEGEWTVAVDPSQVQPISQVQLNAGSLEGSEVTVHGTVTVPNGVLSLSRSRIVIQDSSGYGIQLDDPDATLLDGFSVGDSLQVRGTVTDYQGTTQLQTLTLTTLATGTTLPDPFAFGSTWEMLDEQGREGALAAVTGQLLDSPGTGSYNLVLDDGSGALTLRIHEGAGLDLSAVSFGDTLAVEGLLGVFSGQVQLYPTEQTHITVLGAPEAAFLANGDLEEWRTDPFALPEGWRLAGHPDLALAREQDAGQVFSGTSSAELTLAQGAAEQALEGDLYQLGAGSLLEVSAAVLDDDPDGHLRLGLAFLDETGAQVGLSTAAPASADSGDWQLLALSDTLPAGASHARVLLEAVPDAGQSGDFVCHADSVVARAVVVATVERVQTDTTLLGRSVRLRGIVTQAGDLTAPFTDAYLQDTTGYGVNLYAPGEPDSTLDRGDSLEVTGVVGEYNGVTQLQDWTATELASGLPLPDPWTTTTGAMAASQQWEGSWAQVTGYIQNPLGPLPWTLYVDDGSGQVQVRIWSDTGLDLTGFEQWDAVTVRGTLDLYDGEVQLQPSQQEDLAAATLLPAPANLAAVVDSANHNVLLSWSAAGDPNLEESFRYYGIYRNDAFVATVPTGTEYTDSPFDFGQFDYRVTAYYDVGVSAPSETLSVSLPHALWAPGDLQHELVDSTGEVTLSWQLGGSFGEGVETMDFDSEAWQGSYIWPGNAMAVQFSTPEGDAELLALQFFTTLTGGAQEFNALVYDWGTSHPSHDTLYAATVRGGDMLWTTVDVQEAGIVVDFDFLVGFGSLDESVALAFETGNDNYRSWDYVNGSWSQRMDGEHYGIRAVVRYVDGTVEVLESEGPWNVASAPSAPRRDTGRRPAGDELDDLANFLVYRDGILQGEPGIPAFTQELPGEGEYVYEVVASYDEGDSEAAVDTVTWVTDAVGEDGRALPEEYALDAAWPNPFNPALNLRVAVPRRGRVEVVVYDLMGRRVAKLVDGSLAPGYHRLQWTPQNLASGLYFVHMRSQEGVAGLRKVMYVK